MSSDSKPTSAEPEPTSNLAKSFDDRLSFPTESKPKPSTPNPAAASFTPSSFSWADDVETPVEKSEDKKDSMDKKSDGAVKEESSLEDAQKDGANVWLNGSPGFDQPGLSEPEFDVNVKLADLQEDPNNPLFSAKSFEELNM